MRKLSDASTSSSDSPGYFHDAIIFSQVLFFPQPSIKHCYSHTPSVVLIIEISFSRAHSTWIQLLKVDVLPMQPGELLRAKGC